MISIFRGLHRPSVATTDPRARILDDRNRERDRIETFRDSDCLVTLSRNSGGLTNLAGYRTRRHRVLRASSWVLVELLPCDSILFVGRFLGALDNQGAVVAIRVREAHIDP